MTEINDDELRARVSALRKTMTELNDDELRARFSALREQHARVEPEFRAMLNRAARSSHTDRFGIRSNMRWVAVAAAILIAAALIVGKARDLGSRRQAALATQTITTWQSPTAGLLQPTARDLLSPPPLLSSVFDGVASPTLQLKTD
jgi:hypothetical protein